MSESKDIPDFRPESPYSEVWYEDAKERGARFVDWLINGNFTSEQIGTILAEIPLTYGNEGAVSINNKTEGPNWRENEEAMDIAVDWINEVTAGAQDHLESKGVKFANDMRKTRKTPRHKYKRG